MTNDAAHFQSAFAQALFETGDRSQAMGSGLFSQPAFTVYRNTVMKGCVDALEANFPTVLRLVGERCFRGLALDYANWQPPEDARLLHYGRSFPDFLELADLAREVPYLANVARLDRSWIECHVAADAGTDAAFLAQLSPEEAGAVRVLAHPAARWCWFPQQPVFTIWSRNRMPDPPADGEIEWHGEGALLTRSHDAVLSRAATRIECIFLDACSRPDGASLADAAAAALAVEPDADLAALLAALLRAGALTFPLAPLAGRSS